MTMTPAWEFATKPAARHASVMLVVFARGPLAEDVAFSMVRFGAPSRAALDHYEVRSVERATDPVWFDAFRRGSLRAVADRDLAPAELVALDAADHAHVIRADIADPADLSYLQAAWALARYLVARGGGIVLDAVAIRWLSGTALPPVDAKLDVGREVQIIYETDSTRPDNAHALHTRGMRKFGAPDLVALCSDDDADVVAQVVARLAGAIARGMDVTLPRHPVPVDGVTWFLVDDEHGLAHLLNLNNDARVLVDERGHDLVGLRRN